MGNDVVLIKNGHRICGIGAALANSPINQNKAYFEMKIQQDGYWAIGLAVKEINLNKVPLDFGPIGSCFAVLNSNGEVVHDGNVLYKLDKKIELGDIIGVTYDHIELKFYVNNQPIEKVVTNLKGELFPILCVDKGSILDVEFEKFQHEPPAGYDRILIEKSLL